MAASKEHARNTMRHAIPRQHKYLPIEHGYLLRLGQFVIRYPAQTPGRGARRAIGIGAEVGRQLLDLFGRPRLEGRFFLWRYLRVEWPQRRISLRRGGSYERRIF